MKTSFNLEIKPVHTKMSDGDTVDFEGGTFNTTLEISVGEMKENHNVLLELLEKAPETFKKIVDIIKETDDVYNTANNVKGTIDILTAEVKNINTSLNRHGEEIETLKKRTNAF